jgi:glutamate synthase domain-containing protein 2/glutamate synthase domain-containing protein 3
MHAHVRKPTDESYAFFEALAAQHPVAVRDMLELVPTEAIPLEEVEPEEAILARFSTQAMSLGALSPEAHKTLALAMNALGGRSNTGEGGEDNLLYRNEPEAANKIKQVASGRFGVTTEYLVHAEEIEIKMAQGSKPGEGGQLPAKKVSEYIARIRHAVPGMPLISPPPHHDIYSIEDLAQLIHDLKAVNPRARVGVKLVSGAGVGVIAAGVAKAGADVITISGHSGGTGSSPLTSIKNTGLPWEIGLRDTHETLIRMGLRSRVTLRTDGGFKFARDILVATVLGADEYGFGTSSLLAMGCIMARQCHLNTCPVGIATQDEALRAKFTGKPEMVVAYFRSLAEEVRVNLARLGARTLHELVGAEGRLRPKSPEDAPWLESLLAPPPESLGEAQKTSRVSRGLDLAHRLAKLAVPTGETQTISNSDRSVGAHLSGELERGNLDVDTNATPLEYEFRGAAGQSFGAWLVPGVTLRLTGEANDYVGKGLCGGVIAVNSGAAAARRGDSLVGNTCLYGATAGRLFVAGRGGERFAVRNSGALAVIEGVGQHGCEYMTGGLAVILGSVGLNFGSGMTGGLAYLMPAHAKDKLNREFVTLVPLEAFEEESLRAVLAEHVRLTNSPCGAQILRGAALPFWRVQPKQLPCSIERTWEPTLTAMAAQPKVVAVAAPVRQVSQSALGN